MQQAFIHILCAELSCPLRRTAAVVSIDSIHTDSSILTLVIWAVINIPLTSSSLKPWKTVAFKSEVTGLSTGASVGTGGRCTGHIGAVTVLACEPLGALALVGTWQVEAGAAMFALSWHFTLVDINVTLLPREAFWAYAGELVGHGDTSTAICAGLRQASISPLALFTCKTNLAGALIGVSAQHLASASIQTGARHKAGVRGRELTVLSCESRGTSTCGFP